MSQERLVMDPATTGRDPLDITAWVGADGLDSGEAAAVPYKAEGAFGEDVIDVDFENVAMSAPLVLREQGGTTLATIRRLLQSRVALWQREGGILARYTASGTAYATITNASLTLDGGLPQALEMFDVNAMIAMERKPGWEAAEVELSLHEEKTNPELIFTETGIKGDMPAPVRVEVVEKQGVDQNGLILAFRARRYSSASTAKSVYEAEALNPLDIAKRAALSGASGGTVVQHGTVGANWTPILGLRLGGTAYLTHEGTNRVFARVYSTSGPLVAARLVWGVGDIATYTENSLATVPDESNFYLLDLGEIRLGSSSGAHRWDGQIQARGETGAEDFKIDRVWIINSDDCFSALSAPFGQQAWAPGLAAYSARSEFNTESGAITGDALLLGGSWTAITNSDTDDFTASSGAATRTATSDSGTGKSVLRGRGVTAGTAVYSNVVVTVDVGQTNGAAQTSSAALTRVTDSSNYAAAELQLFETASHFSVSKVVAGVTTYLDKRFLGPASPGAMYTIRFGILSSGFYGAQIFQPGASASWAEIAGYDAVFVTGGTLASGRIGMADAALSSTSNTRTYMKFGAWVPSPDAVVFASRSLEATTVGFTRLDAGGTAPSPVARVVGDLPRLPVGGTTEVLIKASRGDLGALADPGIDDIAARVFYRPTYLTFPGG